MSSKSSETELEHAPQRLVVDASVVLKCYLPEAGSTQAQAIFRDRALAKVELLAPALLPYELSNALLRCAVNGSPRLALRRS